MKPFELVKSEVVPLTHELAVTFRDMTPSPTERDLNPGRLKMLRQKAEADQLLTFHWAKAMMITEPSDPIDPAFAPLIGKELRVNGHHSSVVLAELNGEFPRTLQLHIDEYLVDGPKGLALLFRQFDDRKSGRSTGDISGAYQNLVPALHDVAKKTAKLGIEGITWYNRSIEAIPTPIGDDQYSLFNRTDIQAFLIWLNELFSIKTPEMQNGSVVAAIYATYLKNPEETKKFWTEVARGGQEFDDNAPSTVLDEWLKSIKEGEVEVRQMETYRGCVYAWNAYRDEKQIRDIRYDQKRATQVVSE